MRKKKARVATEPPVSNIKIIKQRRQKVLDREGYLNFFLKIIVIALAVYVFLTQVFLVMQASGNEMYPMVKDGDLVIAYRLQDKYLKDDIVVYTVDGQTRIGRIVAKAGDTVNMDDSGTFTVNGTTQTDNMYPTYDAHSDLEYPYHVPEGCVFILGDYRTQADDSRDYGPISMDDLEAKVITIMRRREL